MKMFDEISLLVRARYPLIVLSTPEEERAVQLLQDIASQSGKRLHCWSSNRGIYSGTRARGGTSSSSTRDVLAALDHVAQNLEPGLYAFLDLHSFWQDALVVRRLRELATELKGTYVTLVVVTPREEVPPDLCKDVHLVRLPLPSVEDLQELIARVVESVNAQEADLQLAVPVEAREAIARALTGLTSNEAENAIARTIVSDGHLGIEDLPTLLAEKSQIVRKSGLLEIVDAPASLAELGGMDAFKGWVVQRGAAFGKEARAAGLPNPRGVLLLGVQGCGKSLAAKAVAASWTMPLLRLDVGRLFGSLVGSSEANVRDALRVAESVAPCVLWIDEIDKAFGGGSGGESDGGTASRVLGTFLTWLAEKSSPVFVFATANDVRALPPELVRKGRLDEIFFADLPGPVERAEILRIHLAKRGIGAAPAILAALAAGSDGFSGAELEEAIISAQFEAFAAKGPVTPRYVELALAATVPLAVTMQERIEGLRSWAKHRARPVKTPTAAAAKAGATSRMLEMQNGTAKGART